MFQRFFWWYSFEILYVDMTLLSTENDTKIQYADIYGYILLSTQDGSKYCMWIFHCYLLKMAVTYRMWISHCYLIKIATKHCMWISTEDSSEMLNVDMSLLSTEDVSEILYENISPQSTEDNIIKCEYFIAIY